jgi:hypothetical protein
VNRLGLTELNVARRYFIDQTTQVSSEVVPIGYAVPDTDILLLDEQHAEVAVGEIGEIGIQSRYLALGYWRNEDLTRRAFLPSSAGGDKRIYLTGDLGRLRPDGCLEHLGRKDFQAKVRGHRVEVAEIETALRKREDLAEVAVMAHKLGSDEVSLVAYAVPAPGRSPTAAQLRSGLVEQLPSYMIPAAFVFLDRLPLTAHGKLDRAALPIPPRSRPSLDAPPLPPRGPIEEQLVAIWVALFGFEPVGVEDDFFELGGHSLLAGRLLVQVREAFGVELPLSSFLAAPRISQLARLLLDALAQQLPADDLSAVLAQLENPTDATR